MQAHPKIYPYRSKITIENWEDICIIFAQDRANGQGARTALEVEAEIEAEGSINLEGEEFVETNSKSIEDDAMDTLLAQQRRLKRDASVSESRGVKRKPTSSQALYNVLGRMADSLDKYLNSESSKATTQMVLDEVNKAANLDQIQVLKAVDLLMNDQRKFETFIGLPNELKRQWILMHLGS